MMSAVSTILTTPQGKKSVNCVFSQLIVPLSGIVSSALTSGTLTR